MYQRSVNNASVSKQQKYVFIERTVDAFNFVLDYISIFSCLGEKYKKLKLKN